MVMAGIKSFFYEEMEEKESSIKLKQKGFELPIGSLRCKKGRGRK